MLKFELLDWLVRFDLRAVALGTLIAVMTGAALARWLLADQWRHTANWLAWLFLTVNIWLGLLSGIPANSPNPPGPGLVLGFAVIHGLMVCLVFLRTSARIALIALLAITAGGGGLAWFI